MPDDAVLDTPVATDGPQAGTEAEGDGSAPQKENQFFIGTYRSKEDAEKAMREKDDAIRRLKSERDKALNSKDVLAQLASALKADKPTEPHAPALNMQELAKRIEDGGPEVIAEMLARNAALAEEIAEEKATSKQKQLLEQLEAMREQMLELAPEYRSVDREEVARIQEEFGVDRQKALKIAAKYAAKVHTPPPSPRAGSMTNGQIVADRTTPRVDERHISAVEGLPGIGKLTDAERKALMGRA